MPGPNLPEDFEFQIGRPNPPEEGDTPPPQGTKVSADPQSILAIGFLILCIFSGVGGLMVIVGTMAHWVSEDGGIKMVLGILGANGLAAVAGAIVKGSGKPKKKD